jgi:hypothetical protein
VDVANLPSTTTLSLESISRLKHKEMPNLIISDSQIDDLIAYLMSSKHLLQSARKYILKNLLSFGRYIRRGSEVIIQTHNQRVTNSREPRFRSNHW